MSGSGCVRLAFQLSAETALVNRRWSIKVNFKRKEEQIYKRLLFQATQYDCDFPDLAPQGCDQVWRILHKLVMNLTASFLCSI